MAKKKKLTQQQEFEIMKLVLDKFLWLGFAVMVFGLLVLINDVSQVFKAFSLMIVGAIVLILFMIIIVKEYEIIK